MTNWTKNDVFLSVCTILFSTVLAWLLAGLYSIYMLNLVPLMFTAPLAWLLKKRGKRLRFFAGTVAAFDVLLLAGVVNLNMTIQVIQTLTGYSNGEVVAFSLLLPLFCGCGILAGLGLGALVARLGSEA